PARDAEKSSRASRRWLPAAWEGSARTRTGRSKLDRLDFIRRAVLGLGIERRLAGAQPPLHLVERFGDDGEALRLHRVEVLLVIRQVDDIHQLPQKLPRHYSHVASEP